ncbi:pyruvate decarboxylase [Apiospora aurea]|uniref:Pyruvate decarboxylase n=1 Tax=Apiospora aurea TaxID=335848 RepID=A0ABR1PXR6_9PEZI
MAEPLSLAASMAGLISLGLQVTGGIAKYLDAVKCRNEELSAVRQQNALLTDTLATIEKTTGKLIHLSPEVADVTKRNFDSFKDSVNALEGFAAQLASCNVVTWRSRLQDKTAKLRYAFDRPKLEQLCARVKQAQFGE